MNLRTKLSIMFGTVVFATVATIGVVTYNKNVEMGTTDAQKTIQVSADLASSEIEGKLSDFSKMARVSGHDAILAGSANNVAVTEHVNELAEQYAFTSGNILGTNGISRKDGTDFSDRDYVKKALAGEVNISDLTLSKYTGNYGFSVASPVYNGADEINGVVYYRMDVDFMSEILEQIEISKGSYTYLVDGSGMVIVHPDKSLIGEYNISEQKEGVGKVSDEILAKKSGAVEYKENGVEYLCGYSPVEGTNGWTIVVTAPVSDFLGAAKDALRTLLIVDVLALIISFVVAELFANNIGKSVKRVSQTLAFLSKGELEHPIPQSRRRDEIGQLQNSARELQQTFKEIINETNRILGGMANYDLARDTMNAYPGDFNQLSEAVNGVRDILQRLILVVQESANSVGTGSSQLASAADSVATGTNTQASSINQLVLNVEEMAESIMRNSDSEARVQKRLQELEGLIINGNQEMEQLRDVVSQVENMSSDIKDIIATIESIAFQINILSLNASVEAARVGESGKGFAVVAGEIGSLASKTSDASKQIAELITVCLRKIENAMVCADSTAGCLRDIVDNSEEISTAFTSITADTKEQADKSSRIKHEISNISDVVQVNSATAQETAAATVNLLEQAQNLSRLISRFRV